MGAKKWLEPHTKYCFSKFTDSSEEVGKWCIVRADSDGSPELVVPNATRGAGFDPVKSWFEEARIEKAELFSPINLQCFRMNVKSAASKWFIGAHNPENGSNPPRTTTDQYATTTQDQEDNQNGGDDPPAVIGDVLQVVDHEDNVFLVRDTIVLHDGEGNETPFDYVQAKYTTSFTTSAGAYRSKEKCHIVIHMPSGWKLSDQNPNFYSISGNGSQLVLKFKPPPALFTKTILGDMLANFGTNKPYKNLATGTLHPAVSAIMKAAEVGQANNPDVIMRIKLLSKCPSFCAIEGLFQSRDAFAKLTTAPAPAVSSTNPDCCVFRHSPPSPPIITDVFAAFALFTERFTLPSQSAAY
jgi:hypothetical protein